MVPAIEMREISVQFTSGRGTVQALESLSLAVPVGKVFGFLGPNGAGKTTAMHVVLGFIEATAGEARLFGEDARRAPARRRIGYLPEQPEAYPFLTGREWLQMTAALFGMRRAERRARAAQWIEEVGLTADADRRMAQYSRGMMQRICLAQALVHDPDLLILDEPTGGLDPLGRMQVRRLIATLRERGKTVFFSSHELSEVELVCDHLAIVARGRLLAQGPARDLVPPGQSLERYFLGLIGGTGKEDAHGTV